MILLDMNGKKVKANINTRLFSSEAQSRSMFQHAAGEELIKRFPLESVLEEWTIPGSKMSLDFFIPTRMIAIEVQGEQHEKFSPFFHGSRYKFVMQQNRDYYKKEWCEKNNITLIFINDKKEIGKIANL